MEIIWEVEDGYVGKSSPQHTSVNNDEIRECENAVEARQLIETAIDMDFGKRINWGFLSFDSVRKEIHEILATKKQFLPFG